MNWDVVGDDWVTRRRPAAWNILWLVPLAVVLACGSSGIAGERVTGDREVWDAQRVCPSADPCADIHPLVGLRTESGGRRSGSDTYVTFVVPDASDPRGVREVERPLEIGVVADFRSDLGRGSKVWVREDRVLGVVDSDGRRWADFGATRQEGVFEFALAAWCGLMALICLAWVPQLVRWHLTSPRTPGLARLRWVTVSAALAVAPVFAVCWLRFPAWVGTIVTVVVYGALVWFFLRAWWGLWAGRDRERWLRQGRNQGRLSPR